MIEAERSARGDRDKKLRAAHDFFYRGPIADAAAAYHAQNEGFLTKADLAGFEVPVEASISVNFRGYEVHACDVWCQGISLLQALKIIEGCDLAKLGHNSPDYVHTVTEALNLAFGDREAYVGDPKFVKVPVKALLSDNYATRQRARIDLKRAFGKLPAGGNPEGTPATAGSHQPVYSAARGKVETSPDTIYAAVMDKYGNAYSATLSDTTYDAPVIPGTGLVFSSRGQQSRLHARPSGASRARQAPSPYAEPRARHERRQAVHVLRHSRRRRSIPVDAAGVSQRHAVRHAGAAGGRGAALLQR